jgi:trafficking protein particle complex subunit 12
MFFQDDPLTQAITQHFPSEVSKRRQAQMESITTDDRGMKTLITEKCYRGAISLSSRLLTNYGQGFDQRGKTSVKHSSHSLLLWHTRIAVLLKLNQLEIAKNEADTFGDLSSPDLFYEHSQPQPFKSKHGSMASFSFRLLLASDLPLRLGKVNEAMSNLMKMLEITTKIQSFFADLKKTNEADFWMERKVRVLCALINCSMQMKNHDLAHQLFENIMKIEGLKSNIKFQIQSAWGRT